MILLNNVQSLQIVLSGAVATAQPHFYAGYVDLASGALTTPAPVTGTTNSTTAVTWVAAPAASTTRQVKALSLYNADSAAVTVTVRINDNGTNRTLLVSSLLPGDRLEYVDSQGWRSGAGVSAPVTQDFITGLKLSYTSGTAFSVSSGAAYVQSLARRLDSPSTLSKSGLSLSANAFYHVYLFQNGGLPDVEADTAAPTAAYFGGARSKTGDTSRRYLGSFKTNASGQILPFQCDTQGIFWYSVQPSTNGLRPISNGKATSRSTIALSSGLPATATHAVVQVVNSDSSIFVNLGNPSQPSGGVIGVAPGGFNSGQLIVLPTDTNQAIDYYYSVAPTNGVYVDIYGYAIAR